MNRINGPLSHYNGKRQGHPIILWTNNQSTKPLNLSFPLARISSAFITILCTPVCCAQQVCTWPLSTRDRVHYMQCQSIFATKPPFAFETPSSPTCVPVLKHKLQNFHA